MSNQVELLEVERPFHVDTCVIITTRL